MIMEAKNIGTKNIIVKVDSMKCAILVSGVNFFAFDKLIEVTDLLTGIKLYNLIEDIKDNYKISNLYIIDF